MALLVVYDGGRRTRRVAEALRDAAVAEGTDVMVQPVALAATSEATQAAGLLVGCGVNARVPFGGERPHRMAAWISHLGPLDGKPVSVFCTYARFPVLFADAVARTSEALSEMSSRFEEKGATVVATDAFQRRPPQGTAAAVVRRILEREAA